MMKRILAVAVLVVAACGDDGPSSVDAPWSVDDAGVVDSGVDASCFTNPQTHEEIINACTTAEKVYKTPVLPLLLDDGGLPPIP